MPSLSKRLLVSSQIPFSMLVTLPSASADWCWGNGNGSVIVPFMAAAR